MTPEELFLKHQNLVYKVYSDCIKESKFVKFYKEDLIQEGMIALWKASVRYNSEKSKFSTFAYISIRNRMWCFLRNVNKTKDTVPFSSLIPSDSEDNGSINVVIIPDPSNPYLIIELGEIINNAVNSVGRNCGTIIKMSLEGYSQEEIASHINTSQANVSRVLKLFRKNFKENYLNKEK